MRKAITIFLLLLSLGSLAQSISGTLLDEQSRPLSFANVSNAKSHVGSYSDDAGHFSIDASDLKGTDSIVFSHLGYVEVTMTVTQLSEMKGPIRMQPKNYSLREVVVGPGGAKDLLEDALSHIKDNYPAEFTNNHIIFRDYLTINGEKEIYDNFDFNMYIPSYMAKDSPRIYTVDNKHERYEKVKGLFHPAIHPTWILKLMYPERFFDQKMLTENDFQMVSASTLIDGEDYDVIEFYRKPHKGDHHFAAKGHVYINKIDKGIRFIDCRFYSEESSRIALIIKVDTSDSNVKIAYKKVDGKYMLDYIYASSYGVGSFFGRKVINFTASAKVIDRQPHLKMNQIVMKTEVDDIFTNEKPKDIRDLKKEPDMR
jgi:hypothetical protein